MSLTELGPYDVMEKVGDAIVAATELTLLDQLLGDKSTPSPELHRAVRVDVLGATPFGDAAPDDAIGQRLDLAVLLFHAFDTNAHRASYKVASQDLVATIRAVLTRTELSGLGQPAIGRWTVRRVGHTIETTLPLQVQHHVTLPEAAP